MAAILWGLWAFSSELMLHLRLNSQVDALRTRNAQLADANAQARRKLADSGSPAALEAAAREQGFGRQGEQVFILTTPGAQAGPTATPAATSSDGASKSGGSVWHSIARWWRNRWH